MKGRKKSGMCVFGTVSITGKVTHATHKRRIENASAYEWECLLAGEQIPTDWDADGNVVEWEFLEEVQ